LVSDLKNRVILRDPEVKKRTKLSRVQRWRRVRKGTFPAPIQLGPNSIGWFEDEIDAWLAARPRVQYAVPNFEPTALPPLTPETTHA
jgi:prophage regulatory protein